MLGDVAMQRLLYDVAKQGSVSKANGAEVNLGSFETKAYPEISAILYSSTATFGKARALGNDKGTFVFHAFRITDNNELLQIVADKKDYKESLCDGLRLFINPWATHPIDPNLFWDDGIKCFLPDGEGNISTSLNPDGHLCIRSANWIVAKEP